MLILDLASVVLGILMPSFFSRIGGITGTLVFRDKGGVVDSFY